MKKQKFTNSTKDRRRDRDILAKAMVLLNLTAWVIMVIILVVTERAKPQFESFFDRFYRLEIRRCWDIEYVHYLLWITMVGLIVSSAGLVLSFFRARREADSRLFGLLIMGISSVVGFGAIVFFLH